MSYKSEVCSGQQSDAILKYGPLWIKFPHLFPSSASRPQTHYQFGAGMKSLISSWLPSSMLIVLSATNPVLKGKSVSGR